MTAFMTQASQARRPHGKRSDQRGVALFAVLIFVLLSMLLALWASRTSLFNEMVVSNDADYQRAYEAAQALLQDAELDIRMERADGSACTNTGSGDICRKDTTDKIPLETQEVGAMLTTLANYATIPTGCRKGLCAKRSGRQNFWDYISGVSPSGLQPGEVSLSAMTATDVGARYGQFTGATVAASGVGGNPILAATAAGQGGWYWIEVLPYTEGMSAGVIVGAADNTLALNVSPNVVYRITAIANGRKPNTMAVLQEVYAQQKLKD